MTSLFLLIASWAWSQTLPAIMPDTGSEEVAQYLDQRVRRVNTQSGKLAEDNDWAGIQDFQESVTFSSGVTHSESEDFNGPAVFSSTAVFSLSASSPTAENTLYANTIIKGWVVFDGTVSPPTVAAQVNVTSVTRIGTGDYVVTWATDFASGNYAVAMTGCHGRRVYNNAAASVTGQGVRLETFNSAPIIANCDYISVLAVGAQ